MAHFKEGGHAKTKEMCGGGRSYKKGGEVECKDDIKEDKKMIKKAFKQHDEAEHDKDNASEIKLKKGGRAKKEVGTVKKYKCGGGVYSAKKTDKDIKSIDEAKECEPKKLKTGGMTKSKESDKSADAKSGAKEMANKYKKGGKIKKMADGMSTGALDAGQMGRGLQDLAQSAKTNDLVYRPKNPAEQQRLAQKFAIENGPAVDKNASFTRPMAARKMDGMKKGGSSKK